MHRGRVVAHGTVSEIARRAAAPRRATLRVAPEDRERAVAVLRGFTIERRPTAMVVTLNGSGGNEPLQRLLEAGVNVQSYELEAARLSDAFLAMTEAG
jgi:ABC-2 type transport system ATP-binding protein